MTPDYLGLKAEIAKPAYAGMTDAQICSALNAAGTPAQGTVAPNVLLTWGAKTGVRKNIEGGTTSAAIVNGYSVASICLATRDMLGTGSIPFDTSNSDNTGMLDVLTAAGIMPANTAASGQPPTPGSKPDLMLLGQTPGPSIANGYGFASVTPLDLAYARSL